MIISSRFCLTVIFLSLLTACTSRPPSLPRPQTSKPQASKPQANPPQMVPQPPKTSSAAVPGAVELPLTLIGAANTIPGWTDDPAGNVADVLRKSCPALQKNTDLSGLTQASDWMSLCGALAAGNPALDVKALLAAELQAVRVSNGRALNTGYYEAQLDGALQPGGAFTTPLYKRPPDLVDLDLGAFRPNLKGQRLAGRLQGNKLVPYADRGAINGGALNNRGLELLWVSDEWEAFSLQVQGSGQVKLPDGRSVRVGYDGQNGHEYQSVGRIMIERGLMQKGKATMQGILGWARANPDQARELFNQNRSFVFFREIKGDGPIGALNIPLTAERSIAVDPVYVPLGAPVWLDSSHQNPDAIGSQQLAFRGLRVAQDTGGAIKGPNRLDIFFGSGPRATLLAGSQTASGVLTLLLPRASVARLQAAGKLAQQ
jgi:membrane-bound lytic murein transglycosylase A